MMMRLMVAAMAVLAARGLRSAPVRSARSQHVQRNGWALGAASPSSEEGDVSRRGLLTKGAGALAVGGLVANKVAVRGPPVFTPAAGSLAGKVIVITGGNNGLGRESAVRLAKGSATIVITVRSDAKGQAAVREIKEESGSDQIYYLVCDLADLKSVKGAAAAFKSLPVPPRIDVLMENAGVMAIPEYQTTRDGFEKQFGVNHLGHFALTSELFPYLKAADKSRIVVLSSSANLGSTKDAFDTPVLGMEKENYTQWGAYCKSKLANVLFTKELDRRMQAAGLGMSVVSVHPGAVRTELARYIINGEDKPSVEGVGSNILSQLGLLVGVYFTKSVDRGANTQVWLAAGADGPDPMKASGGFYQNLKPGLLNPASADADLAKRLWEVSEKLTDTKFSI